MKELKLFGKSIICLIIALVCVLAMMTSCNSASNDDDEDEEEEEEETEKENPAHKHSYLMLDGEAYFVTLEMSGKKPSKIDFYSDTDYVKTFTIELEYNLKRKIESAKMLMYGENGEETECNGYSVNYDKKGKLTELSLYDESDEVFSIMQTENEDGDSGYAVRYGDDYSGYSAGFLTLNKDNMAETMSVVLGGEDDDMMTIHVSYTYDKKGRITEIKAESDGQGSTTVMTYDKDSCCFSEMKMENDGNFSYVFTRDGDHNVVKYEYISDYRNTASEFKYEDGRQIILSRSSSLGEDENNTIVYTYNDNNVLTSSTQTGSYEDWEGYKVEETKICSYRPDGTVESIDTATKTSMNGVISSEEVTKTLCDENGDPDTFVTVTKAYDDNGNMTDHMKQCGEHGYYSDEITEEYTYLSTYETYYSYKYPDVICVLSQEYNEDGYVVKSLETYYTSYDKTKVATCETVRVYEGEDLVKEDEITTVYYLSGGVEATYTNTEEYNSDGSYTKTCVEKQYDESNKLTHHEEEITEYDADGYRVSYQEYVYLKSFETEYNDEEVWCEEVNEYDEEGNVVKTISTYFTLDDNRTKIATEEYAEKDVDGILHTWTTRYHGDIMVYYEEARLEYGYWSNRYIYSLERHYDEATGELIHEEVCNYYDNGNVMNSEDKQYAFGKLVEHHYYEYYTYGWTKSTKDYVIGMYDDNDNVIGRIIREYAEGNDDYVFRTTTEYFDENGNVIDSVVENHGF